MPRLPEGTRNALSPLLGTLKRRSRDEWILHCRESNPPLSRPRAGTFLACARQLQRVNRMFSRAPIAWMTQS